MPFSVDIVFWAKEQYLSDHAITDVMSVSNKKLKLFFFFSPFGRENCIGITFRIFPRLFIFFYHTVSKNFYDTLFWLTRVISRYTIAVNRSKDEVLSKKSVVYNHARSCTLEWGIDSWAGCQSPFESINAHDLLCPC